jgi:hypothetical protein
MQDTSARISIYYPAGVLAAAANADPSRKSEESSREKKLK